MVAIHTVVKNRRFAGAILFPLLLLSAYLIKNPTLGADAVRSGLRLFTVRLLPALFPMAVIAAFFCRIGRIPLIPVGFLAKTLRISQKSATALVFGLFAGFPIGALALGNLYRNGEIPKEEAESLLGIVSNPGIAFLIGGVGAGIFGDRRIGVVLYLSQTAAVLLLAFLRRGKALASLREMPPSDDSKSEENGQSAVGIFCDSVGSATVSMLSVCGYVVFFAVLTDFALRLLSPLSGSEFLRPLVSGFLEIGSGMQAAGAVGGVRGFLLAAAFAGWSGLSVLMQIASGAVGLTVGRAVLDRALLAVAVPVIAYGIASIIGLTIG